MRASRFTDLGLPISVCMTVLMCAAPSYAGDVIDRDRSELPGARRGPIAPVSAEGDRADSLQQRRGRRRAEAGGGVDEASPREAESEETGRWARFWDAARDRADRLWRDAREIASLPEITVDLMHAATRDNDPFYARIVEDFYRDAQRPHARFPLVRALRHGVALCPLPPSFEGYFAAVEASARRNFRKAERKGYVVRPIDRSEHLADIAAIRGSTTVRQGKLPESIVNGPVTITNNPPSRSRLHDYAYFGTVMGERLVAYAGCFVSGELCMVEHIYGHAAHQADGVVPMLLIGMARELYERHPEVRYYGYGTYYGAGETMRRFKRKFGFVPHRVTWKLG